MVVRPDEQVVVIAPQDREEEIVIRLARIGFDHVAGLPARTRRARSSARPSAWPAPAGSPRRSSPTPCARRCRRFCSTSATPASVAEGAIPGALHIPLAELPRRLGEVPPDRPVVTYCAGGYRSSVAACLLRAQAAPTSRTCSAATAPGPRSRNRSVTTVAADERCVERAVDRVGSRLVARSSARQPFTARPRARTPGPRRRGGPAACASRGPCGAGPSAATGSSPSAGWR